MLTKLILRNFQKYEKFIVDLNQPITIIVGPTDAGKSSLLRALWWVCTNNPSGDEFIKKGEAYAKVILKADRRIYTRRKGSNQNYYRLGTKVYRAFGSSVPPDVSTGLNIRETNFQDQHDRPFWFSLSPGQVSKELNQIVNLESIDKTLGKIASRVRSSKWAVEATRKRFEEVRQAKKELAWVVQAEKALAGADKCRSVYEAVSNRRAVLGDLLEQAQKAQAAKSNAIQRLNRAESVANSLTARAKQLSDLLWERDRLEKILIQVGEAEEDKWQANETLKEITAKIKQVKVCPACGQPIR